MTSKRCAIYARISVTSDDSVSLARQVEAAEQYAAARGWQVVATYRDDGVSASHNKPEARAGWTALINAPEPYEVVLIWKVDRLARRVLDFLRAHEALQERGAAVAAVADPVDMTTAQGRAFATMLAVFAEMEAEAIRARVAAARAHLLSVGRLPGGTVPYGWKSVKNPDGAGYVLAIDPDRSAYILEAAERARRGDTLYSVVQWFNEVGAPLPTASQKGRKSGQWHYGTLERLLRNPVLAGMTAYNPGNHSKVRGAEVLRDKETGLPVVDESIAIMPVADWRALIHALDSRDGPTTRPFAQRSRSSSLLSGLMWCAADDKRMVRGRWNGREGYTCTTCYQTITNFESLVLQQFLEAKGDQPRWSVVEEVHEGGAAMLPEIETALGELTAKLQATDDDAEAGKIMEKIGNLRAVRREQRAKAPRIELVPVRDLTQSFGEDWEDAETVEEQRAVLDDAITRIHVSRGRAGRRTPAQLLARLTFDWKLPDQLSIPK